MIYIQYIIYMCVCELVSEYVCDPRHRSAQISLKQDIYILYIYIYIYVLK